MNFFKGLWAKILELFGVTKSEATPTQEEDNDKYRRRYEDIKDINYTAIFASKISSLTFSDSNIIVAGDNMRAEKIKSAVNYLWSEIKKIGAKALGIGGCLAIPYINGEDVLFTVLSQDRLIINEKRGNKIVDAVILADMTKINNETYYRWTRYKLDDGICHITNTVTDYKGQSAHIPEWEDIQDVNITGCAMLPFAYLRSVKDDRKNANDYGVPITYGCDVIIREIRKTLQQVADEYELKQVKLGVDERNFVKDENGKVHVSKLYELLNNPTNEKLFEIFDPAIRDSSYSARLNMLYEQLEKEVGTSKGILTEPTTNYATATEIKAGNFDTFCFVSDFRKEIEKFVNEFASACDVLCNAYGVTPTGEYTINIDWSTNLVESTQETWQQLVELKNNGGYSTAELRAWQTGETLEQAQAKVDEIKATEPSLQQLIGNAE